MQPQKTSAKGQFRLSGDLAILVSAFFVSTDLPNEASLGLSYAQEPVLWGSVHHHPIRADYTQANSIICLMY